MAAWCTVHRRQMPYLIRCVGLLRLRPPRALTLLTQPLALAPHLEVARTQSACRTQRHRMAVMRCSSVYAAGGFWDNLQ